jgi:hypothetical protein
MFKSLFLAFCRDLGNAGISGPLLPDLAEIQNLQYMYESHNQLQAITESITG